MEMKNICGKIPLDLHSKVRKEIEQCGISTQEFLQQVIEEHFIEKGVVAMAARTIAVQVSEELYTRLKAAVAWKGCKQKDFLIRIITEAIEKVETERENMAKKASDEGMDEPEPLDIESEMPEAENSDEMLEETATEPETDDLPSERMPEDDGETPTQEDVDIENSEMVENLDA